MPSRLLQMLICTALLLTLQHKAAGQVTANAIKNVYQIKIQDASGTAFTLQVDGGQYLITAKHLVRGLKADGTEETINIMKLNAQASDTKWEPLKVRVFPCHDPIDIAVLVADKALILNMPLEPKPLKMFYGQEAYFLGFPFGLSMTGGGLDAPYPIPILKRGTLAAFSDEGGFHLELFDGLNNIGFSGAPVVFRDLSAPNSPFFVSGIVTGFMTDTIPTTECRRLAPGESPGPGLDGWRSKTISGQLRKDDQGNPCILEDTKTLVPVNTGLVITWNIQHAIDLIKLHPIGPLASLPK